MCPVGNFYIFNTSSPNPADASPNLPPVAHAEKQEPPCFPFRSEIQNPRTDACRRSLTAKNPPPENVQSSSSAYTAKGKSAVPDIASTGNLWPRPFSDFPCSRRFVIRPAGGSKSPQSAHH